MVLTLKPYTASWHDRVDCIQMVATFLALIPVILIIALGCTLKSMAIIGEKDWAGLERVGYLVFFPALIVDSLIRSDLSNLPIFEFGGALIIIVLLAASLLLLLKQWFEKFFQLDGPGFTSVFQACTRWNTFIALAVAQVLYGERGVALTSVALAAMSPLLNVMAVYVLTRYGTSQQNETAGVFANVIRNPIFLACFAGLLLNPLKDWIPGSASSVLHILGMGAFSTGLLAVGAGLQIHRLKRIGMLHVSTTAFKLVVFPLCAFLIGRAFGLSGVDLSIIALVSSVPTAGAGYILARQMGGDAPLMAEFITLQSLAAFGTIPLILSAIAGL